MQNVSVDSGTGDSAASPVGIALCIPTYRRNDQLRQCLGAIAGLRVPGGHRLLLLVVDNDAAGGARGLCEEQMRTGGMQLQYIVEAQRGLSSVRNRLLEEALRTDAEWLAFVDDDEQPAADWLLAHLHALAATGADVSSGPVIQQALDTIVATEQGSFPDAMPRVPRFVACNNVMFRRKLIADQGLRFDPLFNHSGGEDFDFFEASRRCGNRHIWTGTAAVYEALTPERSTVRYLFHRHWSGAMTRVMQQRKWHGAGMLWPRFLVKICGKLLGGTACLLLALVPPHRGAIRNCVKRFASACGYACGLLNFKTGRYH